MTFFHDPGRAGMSIIQSSSELVDRDHLIAWATANPTVPRILGIDVGQANLAMWLGAPRSDPRIDSLAGVRFHYLGWVIVHCASTKTTASACALVRRALELYRRSLFAMASDIVIEKQHKKNPRMRAIATTIRQWIRDKVPHSRNMRVTERQAMHKFANIAAMPCPMPREYAQRKEASLRVVSTQVQQWAGERWWHFLESHRAASGDDLSDAALIAQDYAVARYLLVLVGSHALQAVSRQLIDRRNRNTWRPHRRRRWPGQYYRSAAASTAGVTFSDDSNSADDDDDDDDRPRRTTSAISVVRKRTTTAAGIKPLDFRSDSGDDWDGNVERGKRSRARMPDNNDDDAQQPDEEDADPESLFAALQRHSR